MPGTPPADPVPATAGGPAPAASPKGPPPGPGRQSPPATGIQARAIVERWDHFADDSPAFYQAHVSYVGTVLRTRGKDAAVALARLLGTIRGARQPGPPYAAPPGTAPQAGATGLAALLSSPHPPSAAAPQGTGPADPALAGRVAAMDARRLDAAWGKLRPGPDLDAARALARWLAGGYQHLPLTIRDVTATQMPPQEQAVLRVAYYLHASRGDLHGASHLARHLLTRHAPPPQATDATPGIDGTRPGHLTAAVSNQLRRPALAAAGLQATRDDVRRASRALAGQQQGNTQAHAALIAPVLATRQPPNARALADEARGFPVSRKPLGLPGGAIGVEIETEYELELPPRLQGKAFTLYMDGSMRIEVDYVGGVPIAEVVTRPARALDEEKPWTEDHRDGWGSQDQVYARISGFLGRFEEAVPAAGAPAVPLGEFLDERGLLRRAEGVGSAGGSARAWWCSSRRECR